MILKTLYKKTTHGKIQQWQIDVDIPGGRFRTVEGLVDGKQTYSNWTDCKPTNVGKKNERNKPQQADFESQAKIVYMMERGYVETISEVDVAASKFKPMLAQEYAKLQSKIKYPLYSQPKLDGMRCMVSKDGMFSRDWKPIVSAPHIKSIIDIAMPELFNEFPDIVIDGELYNHDLRDNFNKIISLVRKTKPTEKDLAESVSLVQFHIFDVFFGSNAEMSFSERKECIEMLFGDIDPSIVIVNTVKVMSQNMLDLLYAKYRDDGYEGQMLRLNNFKYEQKRTNNLLKRKEFMDDEFEIVDVLEGVGNRAGTAGMLVLRLKSGATTKSGIRGNFDFFKDLLNNKQSYIGKKATCRFQNYTPDNDLRFPVVVTIRDYE